MLLDLHRWACKKVYNKKSPFLLQKAVLSFFLLNKVRKMSLSRIELETSCLQDKRSTTELQGLC